MAKEAFLKHVVLKAKHKKQQTEAAWSGIRKGFVDIEQLRKESGYYDLYMESTSYIRKNEVFKYSVTSNNKAEIDLLKSVEQFRKEHGQFVAKLESERQNIRARMEEYSARKRAIYQERVAAFDQSGDTQELGPYYRKSRHKKNERDDVYQSGVVYHGLLHPGAFPHNIDMHRRKSYQDTVSLKKQSVGRMNHSLLQQEKKRLSLAGVEVHRRTRSAPASSGCLTQKDGKWNACEDRALSRVDLTPKQYLVVLTPKNHPRYGSSTPEQNWDQSARLLTSRGRRCRSSNAWL